jgi:FKBP-type peptidyl-prolyl cis-trans isomerase 2
VEEDQDTDLTTLMVTILVVNHIGVEDNLLLINNRTMLIDTNHMLPGDQVVTDVEKVDVVQEVVKVS